MSDISQPYAEMAMASGVINNPPNTWIDITSDCTWATSYVSLYAAYYNPSCKLVLVTMTVASGVPNQQALVTLSKSVKNNVHYVACYDNANGATRRIYLAVYPSTDAQKPNQIVASYTITGNSGSAYGASLLIPVSD